MLDLFQIVDTFGAPFEIENETGGAQTPVGDPFRTYAVYSF